MSFLNKYTALSIAIQLVACVLIWIVAFAVSPAGDRYFGLMFYFYLPAIYLVSTLLGLKGESGMIAAGVFGIAFGIIFYGVVFGLVVSYFKSRGRELEK
jgi:hypothetical protein